MTGASSNERRPAWSVYRCAQKLPLSTNETYAGGNSFTLVECRERSWCSFTSNVKFAGVLWPEIAEDSYLIAPIHFGNSGYAVSLSTAQLVGIVLIALLTATFPSTLFDRQLGRPPA